MVFWDPLTPPKVMKEVDLDYYGEHDLDVTGED